MKSRKTNYKKPPLVRAEDGTLYPALVPLDMTPGYKRLTRGVHCLIICPSRVSSDQGLYSQVEGKIKECYLNTILVGVGKYYAHDYLVSPAFLVIPKKNGRLPLYFHHKLLLGLVSMADFPKELLPHYGKETFTMSKKKKLKKQRAGKRRVKARTKAELKTKAKSVSAKRPSPKADKKKVKKPSITTMIYAYFDKVGLDKAKYKRCEEIAKACKPDTKFNRQHFSWYRNQYRLKNDLD